MCVNSRLCASVSLSLVPLRFLMRNHGGVCSLAHCQKGAVVLIRHDSSFIAGQVLLRASVEGVLLSLVTEWSLHSTNMDAGYANWDTRVFRSLIDTCSILDAVCYTKHCTIATTLLPAEFRA